VSIREDLRALVWDIGTRFTGPNQEVALPSTVTFSDEAEPTDTHPTTAQSHPTDPFLVGPNSYVKIEFKMKGMGHLEVPSKNISVFPKGKEILFTNHTYTVAGLSFSVSYFQ